MDKFDWKTILNSDSVLGVSNYPEDILAHAGCVRIMPKAIVRSLDLVFEDMESPLEIIMGIVSVDLGGHGSGTLMRIMSHSRFKHLSEMARLELYQRGVFN